jgi:hypothetical protein
LQSANQKTELETLNEILVRLQAMAEDQGLTINILKANLEEREKELKEVKVELEKRTNALAKVQDELDLRLRAYKDVKGLLDANKARMQRMESLEASLAQTEEKVEFYYRSSRVTAEALDMQRDRIVIRIIERLFDRTDVFSLISPPFQKIKDDTLIFNQGLAGFSLRASRNLQKLTYLPYQVIFNRPGLRAVLIALILDVPISKGMVGIELVSPAGKTVVQSVSDANEVTGLRPFRLEFTPVLETARGAFELRIFARDIDAPLRLYEWHKYQLFGLGRLARKAFCGFEFAE